MKTGPLQSAKGTLLSQFLELILINKKVTYRLFVSVASAILKLNNLHVHAVEVGNGYKVRKLNRSFWSQTENSATTMSLKGSRTPKTSNLFKGGHRRTAALVYIHGYTFQKLVRLPFVAKVNTRNCEEACLDKVAPVELQVVYCDCNAHRSPMQSMRGLWTHSCSTRHDSLVSLSVTDSATTTLKQNTFEDFIPNLVPSAFPLQIGRWFIPMAHGPFTIWWPRKTR